MGFFNKYPYTDFHELNLDWILEEMKKCIDEWTAMKLEFANLNDAFKALKKYVEDYFANLDLTSEVQAIITEMISDGSMEQIMQNIYGKTLGVEIVNSTGDMTDPTKVYILSSDTNGYLWFWDGSTFVQSSISYFNPVNALGFVDSGVTDLDNLYRQVYNVPTADLGNVSNIPPTSYGFIVMDLAKSSNSSVQIAFNQASYVPDAPFWIRKKSGGTWSQWVEYNAANYLDFIAQYASGDDLDNLDRQITKITTSDLPYVANVPTTQQGIICVDLGCDANGRAQLAINYSENTVPIIYLRKTSLSGTWGDWYELTGNLWTTLYNGDDLDNCTKPGVYYWTNAVAKNLSNCPISYSGYMVVEYGWTKTEVIQTIKATIQKYAGGLEFVRLKETTSSAWSVWNIQKVDWICNGYGFTTIGDSMSSGVTTRTVGGVDTLYSYNMESWEKILANKLGCKCYACSKSGGSTVDFLNTANSWGITKLAKLPATPVYFINLGINDDNQSVSETDFKNNYNDIIDAIQAKDATALIFCISLFRDNTGGHTYETYSQYIDDVVTARAEDRVVFLDVTSEIVDNTGDIHAHYYNGHFDVIGYKLIGDLIESKVLAFSHVHPELFRYEFSTLAEGNNYQSNGYPFII